MATVNTVGSSALGASLEQLLLCDDIVPGSEASYQLCKTIYVYHVLGAKMAEGPIKMAQFLPREITVQDGPEDDLQKAFGEQWKKDGCTKVARNIATQSRIYGDASLACLTEGDDPSKPLDVNKLADAEIAFNVFDPLNTSGSLVLNQDPNAFDFQKHRDIRVQGVVYHRSRTITLMNEQPIYIQYTSSAFGFVGRSVYLRALFNLKSFVQTMIADDMVARKAGLLVATLKMAGSVVDAMMAFGASVKRTLLSISATNNVISIAEGETIESVDLKNICDPLEGARKHILENIAAAADMPAVMLNGETFAEGFGEGTEDAKKVAAFVDGIREWMEPVYTFLDMITQRRAWNPKFYETIQAKYPERYDGISYEEAFYSWVNSFSATWPSLLREPESEQVRVADTKLKGVIAASQVLLPEVDPETKVETIAWLADEINAIKPMFKTTLTIDTERLLEYFLENKARAEDQQDAALEEPKPNKPFAAADSISAYLRSSPDISDLPPRVRKIEDYLKRAGK